MSVKFSYKILIILIVSMNTANAIKCYMCSSRTNPNCTDIDSSDDDLLKDCSKPEAFCRKTFQQLSDPETTILTRDCGWIKFENYDDDYCMTTNTNFKKEVSCQCFKDGCNSAEGLIISSVLIFLPIVITLSGC